MLVKALNSLESYVAYLGDQPLPVLRRSKRELAQLREREDSVSGREIARVVLQDPLLAVRVLGHIEAHRRASQNNDITTVSHAIMMMGITPFFEKFCDLPELEKHLSGIPQALLGVMKVITRSYRAAHFAHDWAMARHDVDIDEITVAALLHDMAEIVCWVYCPGLSLRLRELLRANRGMRTAVAQEQIFNVTAHELQLALAHAWRLPKLLIDLMNDTNADHPRVRNVVLAVNLARHSSKGWDDPAIPDDLAGVEELLHISHESLLKRLGLPVPTDRADEGQTQ